jgi:exodeoxyribonuclease-3
VCDHIWVAPQLGDRVSDVRVSKQARSWDRPSDHVPVTATIEL